MVGHYALNVGIVVRIHVGKQFLQIERFCSGAGHASARGGQAHRIGERQESVILIFWRKSFIQ